MAWSIFDQPNGNALATTWAVEFLSALGAQATPDKLQFVFDWIRSEGGGGKYNPLNQGPVPGHPELTTTGSQYGGGAADYASWQAGIEGAVAYLNMPNFAGIKQQLMSGNGQGAKEALWNSGWAASHYGYGSNWSSAPYQQMSPAEIAGTAQQVGMSGNIASLSGGMAAGGTGGTAGANYGASQQSVDQYIEQNYPSLAWMYTIPGLTQIFQEADSNQWSPTQLQAALQNTDWWKSHSESARSWEQLSKTDPASAERELQQAETQIEMLFRQFGVQADATLIQQLATQKMELGLNPQELQLAVLTNASFKYTQSQYGQQGGGGGGDIGSYMAEIKQKASQYFYKISDQSAYQWAVKMLQVGGSPTSADNDAGLTPYLEQQAVSQYPWLKQQIVGQGMTLSQYFDPYKQQTASLMETSPYAIDIQNNPTWAKMGSFVDQNGIKRSMTLSEAATYARSQPGWNFTQNANQQYSDIGTQLLKSLGAIGG